MNRGQQPFALACGGSEGEREGGEGGERGREGREGGKHIHIIMYANVL